jgi:hypothetical protein
LPVLVLLELVGCRAIIDYEEGLPVEPPSGEAEGGSSDVATTRDADVSSTLDADAGLDAAPRSDGSVVDAAPSANLCSRATATATSTYSADDGPQNLIDGNAATLWFSNVDACATPLDGGWVCTGTSVSIVFNAPVTVGRVKLFGPRGPYRSGYDVLTAQIVLLDTTNAEVYSATVATSRGTEPNGDVDRAIVPARPNVKTLRIDLLTGEGGSSGLSEVEAYAN